MFGCFKMCLPLSICDATGKGGESIISIVKRRERERAREREKYRGSREMEDIQRAMIMRCSSAGGTHSAFVHAVGAVATFLLLLTCPAQSVQEVRLRIGCFLASSGV